MSTEFTRHLVSIAKHDPWEARKLLFTLIEALEWTAYHGSEDEALLANALLESVQLASDALDALDALRKDGSSCQP